MDAHVVKDEQDNIVLIDPMAAAIVRIIGKKNCSIPFEGQINRMEHFKNRMKELNKSPNDVVIVLINVDDTNGNWMAEALMPGHDWQQFRDKGEIPFARGLVMKDGIIEMLSKFDKEASEKLTSIKNEITVVVVDYSVAEIFET